MEVLPYSLETTRLRNKSLYTSVVDNNEGTKRYFSSIDAEIYFGDIFIDDINAIQYEVTEKALPIYGYNSHTYDVIINGTRIVQGEFSINFTKSGWLLDVIDGLSTTASSSNGSVTQCEKREDYCGQVGKGLFKNLFDIMISFGDHNSTIQSYGSSAHMLKGVRITNYRQMLDASGEPVAELYSFIAQDIVFNADALTDKLNNSFSQGINDTTVSHVNKENKAASLRLAYSLNSSDVIAAQDEANTESVLSLSVLCEHECNTSTYGSIVTSLKILNSNINKKDIQITKISISPKDKRSELQGLPVFKSTSYEYAYDSNRDIMSTISLKDLLTYDRQIYKYFKKQKSTAYIDALVTIELTYKNMPLVFANKPIQITAGSSYNF